MAAAARKSTSKPRAPAPQDAEIRLPAPPPWPIEAGAQHAPIASPAHRLLADLDSQLQGVTVEPVVAKWPPRVSLSVMLGASAVLWGGLAAGAWALFH